MIELYYETKQLNKNSKRTFNLRKSQINQSNDNVILQSIIAEIGLIAILSQSIEFLLEFTEKFSTIIKDEDSKIKIKDLIQKILLNEQQIDLNGVKTTRLKTLIDSAKKSSYYDLGSLILLDKLRENRNYFVHNFLLQNLTDFFGNSAFKKKALKILMLSNILFSQLIQELYQTFAIKTSNIDPEIMELLSQLQFNFTKTNS